MRALVFDDDDSIRELVTMILQDSGFIVEEYDRPGSCPYGYGMNNCRCTREDFCADLIISDMQMPGMTGLQYIVQQLNNGCKVKNIALMSASWQPEEYQHAKELGIQIFKKPFDLDEVSNWIESRIPDIEKSGVLHLPV